MQSLPPDIEEHRDRWWRREESLRVEAVEDAERFIDRVGFAACLTDARRPGPSLYVAVCGRRNAVMPRHVQKDEEASHTWTLKDDILGRGHVYYGKLARGPGHVRGAADDPLLSCGLGRAPSRGRAALEPPGPGALEDSSPRVGDRDHRLAPRTPASTNRAAFNRAIDELQAAMLVVPSAVVLPSGVHLHLDARRRTVPRRAAAPRRRVRPPVRGIARAFLAGAGQTLPGELSRVTGLSRPEAGLGNRALVAEGCATSPAQGVYRLTD